MAMKSNETGRDVVETGTQHYAGTAADPNGRLGQQERGRTEQNPQGGMGTWNQQSLPGRQGQQYGHYYQSAMSRVSQRQGSRGDFQRRGMERRDPDRNWDPRSTWDNPAGRGAMEGRSYGEGGSRGDWTRDAQGREQEPSLHRWARGPDERLSPGYDLGYENRQRRGFWQKEPLTARDVMTRNVRTVTRQSTLREVAQIMEDEGCGIVPVVDSDMKLIGVLTDRDMVIRAFTSERGPAQVKVDDVMTDEVECVTGDESLVEVIDLMGSKQIRRVPVVDRDDRLVGIISMSDIANRADYDEELQEAFEKISGRRSFWSRLFS